MSCPSKAHILSIWTLGQPDLPLGSRALGHVVGWMKDTTRVLWAVSMKTKYLVFNGPQGLHTQECSHLEEKGGQPLNAWTAQSIRACILADM
jgi:hypothetical protein